MRREKSNLASPETSETIAQERLRKRLDEFLSELAPADGQEQILRLRYEDRELAVFPDFVHDFLTPQTKDKNNLFAYVRIDDKNISFGLRDKVGITDFSLKLAPGEPLYHPIGFWGAYTRARYEWRNKNREIIERTSQFIQREFPRSISEREVSLMLTTAKFIHDHIDQSLN